MTDLVIARPMPPEDLREPGGVSFRPARDVEAWIRATFLEEGAPLLNLDHEPLAGARIGVLWTDVEHTRSGFTTLGTCEVPSPKGGKWANARGEYQLRTWFGEVPRVLLTFYAPWCAEVDDASFCALVEHELYHVAQKTDREGEPMFDADENPALTTRPHDVEEFVGVVRRYGATLASGGVERLVAAYQAGPEVAQADIAAACGTCR